MKYREGDILKNPAAESYVIVSEREDGNLRIKSLLPGVTDPPQPIYGRWEYIGNGKDDPALQERIVELLVTNDIINRKLWLSDAKYISYWKIAQERKKAKQALKRKR